MARRARPSDAPALFPDLGDNAKTRIVHKGSGPRVWTIGYERRDGADLIAVLLDAGVQVLADVREKPISRKPDFRAGPLRRLCEQAGLIYESWPRLGSTQAQRDQLKDSGDMPAFCASFRDLLVKHRADEMDHLAELVAQHRIALLCYERAHDECHRSIIADMLVQRLDATIIAIR